MDNKIPTSKRGARRQRKRHTQGTRYPGNDTTFASPVSVVFPKSVIGFPDRLETVLKYSETINYNGSAAPTAQKWSMNSLFDPNNSGSGHQPSFFDTFSAVYGRYYVKRFKVDMEFINLSSSIGAFVVTCYSDQDISGNTVEQLIESKYAQMRTLGLAASGKNIVRTFLPWMETPKLMGQPITEPDPSMYSSVSASPSDIAWAFSKVAAVDGLTNVNIACKAVLYFDAIFKDLLPQISS